MEIFIERENLWECAGKFPVPDHIRENNLKDFLVKDGVVREERPYPYERLGNDQFGGNKSMESMNTKGKTYGGIFVGIDEDEKREALDQCDPKRFWLGGLLKKLDVYGIRSLIS
jgi:hypothetical protein